MIDGANQEVEPGKFVIYSEHGTGQLSLGFIVGFTPTKIRVKPSYSYGSQTIAKTPERIVQISNEIAESMNESFFDKMRNGIEAE